MKGKRRKRKRGPDVARMVQAGLFIGILLVIVTGAVLLWRWDRSGTSVGETDLPEDAFDVEIVDQVFLTDGQKQKYRDEAPDDVILCLGGDPFADVTGENGLAARIAAHTGATVRNAAFPGSKVAAKEPEFDPDYPRDVFSFFYFTQFMKARDLRAMQAYAAQMGYTRSADAVAVLEGALDTPPDVIVIMYDAVDYLDKTPCYNTENDVDPCAYAGAWKSGLTALRETFPDARLVVMSMTWCMAKDPETGALLDGDMTDLGHGKLTAYWTKLIDVASELGITFIDNYYGTADAGNYETYLADHLHLNDAGRDHIAAHFADVVYPEREEQ